MTHRVAIRRPDYVLQSEPKPIALDVFLNERHYAVLRFNGRAYSGCIPTHDGKLISGEFGLREWKSLASKVNKEAAKFENSLSATAVLNARIAAAKSTQMDFFESVGILPGDVAELDERERERILARYGEWLEANGRIPSF